MQKKTSSECRMTRNPLCVGDVTGGLGGDAADEGPLCQHPPLPARRNHRRLLSAHHIRYAAASPLPAGDAPLFDRSHKDMGAHPKLLRSNAIQPVLCCVVRCNGLTMALPNVGCDDRRVPRVQERRVFLRQHRHRQAKHLHLDPVHRRWDCVRV